MGEGPTLPEGAILSPPPCPLRKSREPGALRLMGGTTEARWLPARAPSTPHLEPGPGSDPIDGGRMTSQGRRGCHQKSLTSDSELKLSWPLRGAWAGVWGPWGR